MGLTEQEIIRLAAEQAAKVTMETLEGQRKKAKKERKEGLAVEKYKIAPGPPPALSRPCNTIRI